MKRRLLVAFALVGLLSAMPLAHAGAATQSTSNVTLIVDPLAPAAGTSTVFVFFRRDMQDVRRAE